MRNIGQRSRRWLEEAGISSLRELRQIGSVEAYLRVKRMQPGGSLNLLWALEGVLLECDWRSLTADQKQELRERVEAYG